MRTVAILRKPGAGRCRPRSYHVRFISGKYFMRAFPCRKCITFGQRVNHLWEQCMTLHPEKTRLLEFGRYAEERAKKQGRKKPGTFDFLGLTHICARSRRGKFTVHVRTMRKRLRRSLTAVGEWCQKHRHAPVDEQQKTLNAKLRGHYQYYGRPTNSQSLLKFYRGVVRIWRKWLNRRTRGNRMTWERYTALLRRHPLLPPRICHVWM